MKLQLLSALIAASLFAPAAQADIILVNRDGAGVGLNDPTARAPEGGNPGTTVGEQRRIVYEFAAELWGSILTTNVDVRVGASFARQVFVVRGRRGRQDDQRSVGQHLPDFTNA